MPRNTTTWETKTCKQCGVEFMPKRKNATTPFCSMKCAGAARRVPPEIRFWEHVDKSGECWVWTGARSSDGYGAFAVAHHVMISAHRYGYELHYGNKAPSGVLVMHRCDQPLCVRGEHLFLGSNQDNMSDMVAKGRSTLGEKHWKSSLNEEDIRQIRRRYAAGGISQAALAKEYGVGQPHISDIVLRIRWRHVVD